MGKGVAKSCSAHVGGLGDGRELNFIPLALGWSVLGLVPLGRICSAFVPGVLYFWGQFGGCQLQSTEGKSAHVVCPHQTLQGVELVQPLPPRCGSWCRGVQEIHGDPGWECWCDCMPGVGRCPPTADVWAPLTLQPPWCPS